MSAFTVLGIIAAIVLVAVLTLSFVFFLIAFYVPPRKPRDPEHIDLPEGAGYEPYWDVMRQWVLQARALPHEKVSITSFDGLTLTGNYYEYAPGAPIELMFHGYRGTAERDLAGGVLRCFQVGRSALVVDQRCSGGSDGNVITFGIREHRDCLSWLDFMLEHFGPDVKIILTGISMGASTVLMAGATQLPENVIGILADCGYTNAKDIMYSVIRQMGFPPRPVYPLVKLGARLFGHLDLTEADALRAVEKITVPVIFYHGEADDYVPCEMSRINYEACTSRKQLVLIPGAVHGLSYPVDPQRYLQTLTDFFGPQASYSGEPPLRSTEWTNTAIQTDTAEV